MTEEEYDLIEKIRTIDNQIKELDRQKENIKYKLFLATCKRIRKENQELKLKNYKDR